SQIQTEQSIRLGQWMGWDNSYYTMSDENNYAIWNFLKKCQEQGMLYRGRDVVPWCIRCGTAISQHEILTEEYQERIHKSVFVKLPIIGQKNKFILIWTTTPWTLPANVVVAIHPKLAYAEIKDENGDVLISQKDKAEIFGKAEIIREFSGKDLEGLEYQGMFDELDSVKETLADFKHKVILWDEVTEDEGTGIVHIAPGCGQEDFQLGKKFNLPVINPLDDESRYNKGFGFLTGKLATEVNEMIFDNLRNKNFVYRIEDYTHRYPTCWRCKEDLIFRLVDEWYISMDKLRKPLIKTVKKIEWLPSFGLEREIDWLENMQDWLISKKRYWGLALPIFECSCGHFEVIGSKKELEERAIEGWQEFEGNSPHRPWVDKIKIKCQKCGKSVSRIPDVGNPWLDAGIVSFSTMKYFTDRNYWKKWFPADLICESFPGQFKNWFYSLIVMSMVLEKTNPVKTIFGYALVHDEKGEEMHKSKGNAIWFDEAVEKIGADPMRWLYAKQNPAYNLNFGYKLAEETKRKLLTLHNVIEFFDTYTSPEEYSEGHIIKTKNCLDIWILSRLNSLTGKITKGLDNYDAMSASLAIEDFFINDLSLWYVRRSRKRFQKPASQEEKKEAVQTLYCVIVNLLNIMAPIMPFFTEENYQRFRKEGMPESVHLIEWPEINKKAINKELEEKMQKTREIVNLALAERSAAGIKTRQPLQGLKVKNTKLKIGSELLDLIKEEVNVKEVVFDNKIEKEVELDKEISAELKEEGTVREIIRNIQEMRKKAGLKPKDEILVNYSGAGELAGILQKNRDFILKEAKVKELVSDRLEEGFDTEKEVVIDGQNILLAIKRI
ncbi:MAG: class I tRNA ligase family protein, partial [Candidatus Nealsonbacteria bacterium]|nr:class I tRNA ligase family protein [Candidatus Nealsonbacteria bacterium]